MHLDSYDSIFQQFSTASADEWKIKIIKDLKDEAFDKLIWHTNEDIDVLPFYTKEDNQKYQLNIPEKQTIGWLITERIIVADILTANKEALHALEYGASSLVFDLKQMSFSTTEIENLVKNILFDIAPISFDNYIVENKIILESVVKNSCQPIIKIPQKETIIDELVFALQQGIQQKENSLNFHFSVRQNYFFEIAKLRAFRWLWKQICDLRKQPYNIFIQSETSIQNFSKEDEYSNMLRNTTAAMSSILGGCDSLIVNNHDKEKNNTAFGKRIARNINHILQQESYFNEIQDAAKGSYYIEYLTYQLCKKSWEKFRLSES